jgi:hypothetical protein
VDVCEAEVEELGGCVCVEIGGHLRSCWHRACNGVLFGPRNGLCGNRRRGPNNCCTSGAMSAVGVPQFPMLYSDKVEMFGLKEGTIWLELTE